MLVANKPKTYQQMNDELAELMAWFEGEEVDLDQAVKKYEQAVKLLDEMEAYLQTAEVKIKKIAAKFGS